MNVRQECNNIVVDRGQHMVVYLDTRLFTKETGNISHDNCIGIPQKVCNTDNFITETMKQLPNIVSYKRLILYMTSLCYWITLGRSYRAK